MATIVSVGEEPWPIDFPIVHHTVFFIVIHFCQLFRAEKKLVGVKIGVDLFGIFYNVKVTPIVPGKSELAQVILDVKKFFCSDIREAAVHFILIHALQIQNL